MPQTKHMRSHGPPKADKISLLPKHYSKLKKNTISELGAGDTSIHLNFFDSNDADLMFYELLGSIKEKNNVSNKSASSEGGNESRACIWEEMYHWGKPVPRLVCIQAERNNEGFLPIYRHPIDKHPKCYEFSPCVLKIVEAARKHCKQNFNHALIQLYRSGDDSINMHSDKTLDIQPGTSIINISFGASREFIIRSKNKLLGSKGTDEVVKVTLPHNSLLNFGLKTNDLYTHMIKQDLRYKGQKRNDENDYDGIRISLTLRVISTFINQNGNLYGQGAKHKTLKSLSKFEKSIFLKSKHQTEHDNQTEYQSKHQPACEIEVKDTFIKVKDTFIKEKQTNKHILNEIISEEEDENENKNHSIVKPHDAVKAPLLPPPPLTSKQKRTLKIKDINDSTQINSTRFGDSSSLSVTSSSTTTSASMKEYDQLLMAFSRENKDMNFDWNKYYGEGFDVLDKEDAINKSSQ
mmetsp:Transcript_6233/g.8044  ORF Transcript_6233/g.8044 Transcript_6233/m.8044 type:complete len:464 (-) Transcript_6233:56-1447(-)